MAYPPTGPYGPPPSSRGHSGPPQQGTPHRGQGRIERRPKQPSTLKARLLITFGLLILFIGVFGAGGVTGWMVHDRIQADRAQSEPTIVEIPAISEGIATVVPDVRGMNLNDATQALADLNLAPDAITTSEIPWAGTPGLVVAQDPVVGSAFEGKLHLTLSAPATVPDLVGKTQSEAMNTLLALGVQPVIDKKFDPSKTTGSVIALAPEPGSPLTDDLTITVADVGASVLLSTLDSASGYGGCSTGTVSVNGKSYGNAMSCRSGSTSDEQISAWVVGRHGTRFTALLGVPDTDSTDARVVVRVLADGVEVQRVEAAYGAPAGIDVDISNVLRLEIAVSSPTRSPAVLADALIKGTTDQIDLLEGSN